MTRLNAVELASMNTPLRSLVQRHWELPTFFRMLDRAKERLRCKRILDAGCGNGYSTQRLQALLNPARLVGFDLMPEQIDRARRRGIPGAELRIADITAIDEPDGSFDAVFVFGILHHVPAWPLALREIARVLAPGGVLLMEELHGRAVDFEDRWLGTEHPREARFDWPSLRLGLQDAGLIVVEERRLAWEVARSFLVRKRRRD